MKLVCLPKVSVEYRSTRDVMAHSLPPELELENYKRTLVLTNITDIRDV